MEGSQGTQSSQSASSMAASTAASPTLQPPVDLGAEVATTSSKSKAPAKTRSIAWKHCTKFEKYYEKHKQIWPFARCNYCSAEFPAHSVHNGTAQILKHLKTDCVKCPMYEGGSASKGQTSLTQEVMGAPLVPHSFNQKKIEDKVYKWIIRDEQPFRAVEGKGFIEMVKEMCPKFKIPNRKKVAAGVLEFFILEKAKIMSVIGGQRVSITTDTWTSVQNINYMVVTAYFMDNDWKLHKRILNFCKINSHKGEDIGKTLEICLKGWGIDKVFSINVDNASANDGAVNYMAERLREINTLLFDGKYLHMRCCCHILNLIVKDGLRDLQRSIEAVRNCVKYIHSSPARLDKFKEFAALLNLREMTNIPVDVATQWNSTYKMLDSAVKFKVVFRRMNDEYRPFANYFMETVSRDGRDGRQVQRVSPPTDEDWDKASAFIHFLKRFYEATLALSATKTCTSPLIFEKISLLRCEIEDKMSSSDHSIPSNKVLHKVVSSMMLKFNKYWGKFEEVNKLVYVAHVLNPQMKMQMVVTVYEELGKDDDEIKEITGEITSCLLELFNAYKDTTPSLVRPSPSSDIVEEAGLFRVELRFKRKRSVEESSEISNEVDKYFNEPCESLNDSAFDLLDWWKVNQHRYPVLSRIAKDVFFIPSSTVASENAFSLGGRIVDPFRAYFTPKVVEALVCTSDWLRADEFNFYKEPTEEEVELYKELEALEPQVTVSQTFTS